jgi:hypothetical protein
MIPQPLTEVTAHPLPAWACVAGLIQAAVLGAILTALALA